MLKESDYSGPQSSLNSLVSEDLRLASCDARVEMIEHNAFHCNYVGAALFGSSKGILCRSMNNVNIIDKWVESFESGRPTHLDLLYHLTRS